MSDGPYIMMPAQFGENPKNRNFGPVRPKSVKKLLKETKETLEALEAYQKDQKKGDKKKWFEIDAAILAICVVGIQPIIGYWLATNFIHQFKELLTIVPHN
jgi:hypothetical protein